MLKDSRLEKIAKNLIEYSLDMKKGNRILVIAPTIAKPLVIEILKHATKIGVQAYVELQDDEITKYEKLNKTLEEIENSVDWKIDRIKYFDGLIRIRGNENDFELSDVPVDKKVNEARILKPYMNVMTKRKWVLLEYPTYGLAQKAKMSYEKFSDFVFEVSAMNYEKMHKAMLNLKKVMESTDKVRIVGEGTDLSFSIKNIPAVPCAGDCNIPDGEVFTAPVKESVNGTIAYNTPSPYHGETFNNVKLTFENGKIVEATADNDVDKLQKIFDTDEGAKYIGEFAIGVNPIIKHPMGNILYDEKIDGSLHFTPGQAYEGEADNGNRSAVHWDLVLIQREEYGGGEIYFDDILIRKNGRFVIPELECLNPENLM